MRCLLFFTGLRIRFHALSPGGLSAICFRRSLHFHQQRTLDQQKGIWARNVLLHPIASAPNAASDKFSLPHHLHVPSRPPSPAKIEGITAEIQMLKEVKASSTESPDAHVVQAAETEVRRLKVEIDNKGSEVDNLLKESETVRAELKEMKAMFNASEQGADAAGADEKTLRKRLSQLLCENGLLKGEKDRRAALDASAKAESRSAAAHAAGEIERLERELEVSYLVKLQPFKGIFLLTSLSGGRKGGNARRGFNPFNVLDLELNSFLGVFSAFLGVFSGRICRPTRVDFYATRA